MSQSPPVDISVELADTSSSSSPVVINPEIATFIDPQSSPIEPDETASYAAFDGGVYYVGDTLFLTHEVAVQGRAAIDDGLVFTDSIGVSLTSHASVDVTQALTFAETITGELVPYSVIDGLTLLDTVAHNCIYLREIIDTLNFSDQSISAGELGPIFFGITGPETSNLIGERNPGWAVIPYFDVVPPINQTVIDILVLTDSIQRSVVSHLFKVQTLYFEDSIPPVNPLEQFITQSLLFTDYASTGLTAVDTLSFTETISGQVGNNVSHVLAFSETISTNAIYGRTVTDTLSLVQRLSAAEQMSDHLDLNDYAIRAYLVSVSDNLVFTDQAYTVKLGNVTDTLNLVDSILALLPEIVEDDLSLSDTITHNVIYLREIEDTLDLVDNVAEFSRISVCDETFVTSIGIRTGVTFTWPYASPTITVNVRNPEFGNSDKVDYNTIIRRSVRNELLTGRPTTWPTIQSFKFDFRALSQTQRQELIDFWLASAGEEIGYLDHENRQWRGVLISDQPELIQTGPGCMNEVELEFRGELV